MGAVVVIEDPSNGGDTFGRIREHAGFDVCLATNIDDGIALARRLKPDVIVLDLRLAGIDGVGLIESLLKNSAQSQPRPGPTQPHAVLRVADPIVRFIGSPEDAPTLEKFGRTTGVSAGAFRNWCRTAELKARETLAFARGLRATIRQNDRSAAPKNLLSIVDIRTRRKFLLRCGGSDERLPASVDEFLDRQQFIRDAEAVSAMRTALAGRGHDLVAIS